MPSDRTISSTPSPPAVTMEKLRFLGSTSIFFRVKQGVVLKAPAKILEDQVVRERPSVAKYYSVERQILERLGEHPRVMPGMAGRVSDGATSCRGQSYTTSNADDSGQRAISAATFVALHGSIGFDIDPRTQFAWPAASNLGLVFPMYLTSVIAKANGKAWLRVSFENDISSCELEFFILASATQHVAAQLFDLHIAPNSQRRGILLDNNAFARFNGSITWTGSPLEKVRKLLGAQAVEAYQLSPSRAEELNDRLTNITNCLSMEIWPEVDCPSRLRLRAKVGKLSLIASCLWPAM